MRAITAIAMALALGACEKNAPPTPERPPDPKPDQARQDHVDPAAAPSALETVKVTDNIYMLVGRGGNVGVSVGPDGILIIDDKFAPLAPDIRAALGELSRGKIAFVINTHHHPDHTGGNPVFGKESTIIAHENVRKRLVEGGVAKSGLPVITFDSSLAVHFNGEKIEAIHYAHGHTDTDSVIFFTESNVIHMGDQFFNGRFPVVDLEAGGNVASYIDNVGAVLEKANADTKIIPGHGPLATRADLEKFHTVLTETVAHVTRQMKANKSLAAIQKAGLPEELASWSGSSKWIATIYRSASQ